MVIRFKSDAQVLGRDGDLVPRSIQFDPTDRACLSRSADGHIVFRVGTGTDIVRVLLVLRDGHGGIGHDFELVGSAGSFALWDLRVALDEPSYEYSLALQTADGQAVYLAPTGITNAIERIDRFRLVPVDVPSHDVPEWAIGAMIYQIFPDRFANGDARLDPVGVRDWDLEPTRAGFHGGDLIGIAERAEYLERLGVGAVYLNPIFTSPSNHRYDTRDYESVDPALGGDQALVRLVDELHRRGIKVILDVSINHAHPRWAPFADVVANGATSAYAGWFAVHRYPPHVRYRPALIEPGSWPAHLVATLAGETGLQLVAVNGDGPAIEPSYDAWYGVASMPRIDLANPEARAAMLGVLRRWVETCDIDGWRLDVARYVDHDVWPEARAAVRDAKADALLISEIMGDASRWLQGDGFDTTMNYTFRQLSLDFFAVRRSTPVEFVEGYLRMLAMYSPEVTSVSHNLIGSHDTTRFLTEADGDLDRLRLATFFQMTVPGAPGVYYGDEIGLAGENDPLSRGTFRWDQVDGNPLAEHLAALGRLRKASPALRTGAIRFQPTDGPLVRFERIAGDEQVTVLVNNSDSVVSSAVAAGVQVLATSGTAEHNGDEMIMQPMSGVVLA